MPGTGTGFWSWEKTQNQSQYHICRYSPNIMVSWLWPGTGWSGACAPSITDVILYSNYKINCQIKVHWYGVASSCERWLGSVKQNGKNFELFPVWTCWVPKNTSLTLSAYKKPGPLGSRAAKAIGFIDMMINYSLANAPLQKELHAGKLFSSTFWHLVGFH